MPKEPRKLPDLLFTVPEVGKIINSNANYVGDLIKAGHLKALKLGHLKVSIWEIERFLREYEGKDLTDPHNVIDLEANVAG